jgi:enamine deaminase RidA (YjgF/YER057c/UK114 family)
MNRFFAQYFQKDPPVRATVEVTRPPRDAKLEIAEVAARR